MTSRPTHLLNPGASARQDGPRAVLDLTAEFDRVRAELYDALLEQLRMNRDTETWPEWMNIKTASRYLDMPLGRIYKLVARGEIPHVQEGPGCRISFGRRDLDDWMHLSRREARTPASCLADPGPEHSEDAA